MTRITERVSRGAGVLLLALHALPAVAQPAPETFWRLIANLAAASTQGGKAVASQWPGTPFHVAGAGDMASAPLSLGAGLQTVLAEVRLTEGDAVQLLVMELSGSCITPADVTARYAQASNADFPQPNNPDPVRYRRLEIEGVRVSFGFRGALPGCLAHVVFNPQAH